MLILTRDHPIHVMERVLVAPVTTTVRGIPTEVPLGRHDGLPAECVAALDDVAPVAKEYLIQRITSLSPERMADVARALRRATGC